MLYEWFDQFTYYLFDAIKNLLNQQPTFEVPRENVMQDFHYFHMLNINILIFVLLKLHFLKETKSNILNSFDVLKALEIER